MVILTDTDIIIDHLRSSDREKTNFYKIFLTGENICAITLTSIAEIWQGKSMNYKDEVKIVEELLQGLQIIIPNLDIAKKLEDY